MAIKMGFVKRRCQAEEACVTTGRKSTDPVFRYHSVARFGVIDRGIGRHWRGRDACGGFPNRFAIGRRVVSPRRPAIPRRLLGEAIVPILLYFCHPRPVNAFPRWPLG